MVQGHCLPSTSFESCLVLEAAQGSNHADSCLCKSLDWMGKTRQDKKITSFQPAWLIRCSTPHQGQLSAIFSCLGLGPSWPNKLEIVGPGRPTQASKGFAPGADLPQTLPPGDGKLPGCSIRGVAHRLTIMDIQSLVRVLAACSSPDEQHRTAAAEALKQVRTL